ncbi:2OG-Fe(II) oxygenase [Rhodobium orientis]|uniref:2OG-Fe(II) oxygenase n=2 Tax=Rhodobium orientis TaxID=34017 RepID=A0A327JX08_9HYPH|nr:2OG-Fe(II) oxygenase [Rhodobium orientis]MBK5949785.1 hypothetical protein [Rhodobium orientis]RAI30105.1 hypothetical protein CH339_00810 [Rhodobium orientis]
MAIPASTEKTLIPAIRAAERHAAPYAHWFVSGLFDEATLAGLQSLPFPAPELGGVSGTREAHNATRVYFDVENRAEHPVCRAVADGFQAPETVRTITDVFGADLDGTYLRIEYGQDTDGFWLGPHTDIGVKRFTMLAYLSDIAGHEDLGTDIYADKKTWAKRTPFRPNFAMVFVPSDRSWHGFEPRPIPGVRKSLIINFVTDDWRAREQLAFPEAPVRL